MKTDACNCYLFQSPYQPVPVNIKSSIMESSNCEKILGTYREISLSLEYHINRICRKASRKLHTLSRIAKYTSKDKKHKIFKYFIISEFNYCPIIWMCHGRVLNNKVNHKPKDIVNNDKKIQFRNFIKTWQIYVNSYENLQYLTTELFKVKNGFSHEVMKKDFVFQDNETSISNGNYLVRKNIGTTQYGTECISNLGAKLWILLQGEIKNTSSLTVFRYKIRKGILEKCPCKLCQTYIKNVSYIWLLLDIC